ncbi:MAG: DUF2306 domain-containing protein [Parvularculaceae bacterium]
MGVDGAGPLGAQAGGPFGGGPFGSGLVGGLGRALTALVWISTIIFGFFIVAHYGGAIARGEPAAWNAFLPDLHRAGAPRSNAAIGAHFALGAVLLVLGPIQLFGVVRRRAPALHRWTGRVYVAAAFATAIGGLYFIAARGTVGGPAMSVGFAIYGALMALAAVQTARYAMARAFDAHRAWAVRLFALAVGSWLYRMEYGLWFAANGGAPATTPGHTEDFRGWFDVVMSYFFFVPNLIVAELFVRGARFDGTGPTRAAAVGALGVACAVVFVGTAFFALEVWGPSIVGALAGAPSDALAP